MLRLIGLAAGKQLYHVKGIRIQRHSAQLTDHLLCDRAVAGQSRQLFDLVFQKELILTAAHQQGGLRPRCKGCTGLLCPIAGHSLQRRPCGAVDLHAIPRLFAAADELLLPLAGAQLAVHLLHEPRHDEDRIFCVRQSIAKLLQILVGVGRRAYQRHKHQPLAAKEGDRTRCQHDLLHRGGRAVQHSRLRVIAVQVCKGLLCSGVDKGLIRCIKIIQCAAGLQAFFKFFFTV